MATNRLKYKAYGCYRPYKTDKRAITNPDAQLYKAYNDGNFGNSGYAYDSFLTDKINSPAHLFVSGYEDEINDDIAHQEELRNAADKRWNHAADSRPLHRKGSLNREGWSDPRK